MSARTEQPLYVAVVGPGVADDAEREAAYRVGALLASEGVVVVCGGMTGVMEEVCRGARQAGGTTVGILPGRHRSDANPYVDVALPTGLGELRNGLVVRAADALLAIGGAFGTLSEVALACKGGVPVVGLATWELARGGRPDETIVRAPDAEAAVSLVVALARSHRDDTG